MSGVNSLRALALLVDHPTGLGITEMSRKLKMDGAQCHRLLKGLRSAGYVTRTNATAPRYRGSPKVLRLAARLPVKSAMLRVSRPIMVRLRDETGALVIAAANQISYEFGWLGPDQQ